MSKSRRWKGCLFGCLGAVLAVILFFGFTSYWLVKKGTYTPPTSMLLPDTEFYLHTEITRDNEQVIDFLTAQLKQINQEQLRTLGQSIPFLSPRQFRDKKARKEVLKLLPIQVEMSGDLKDDMVVGVGFSIYNNMARLGFWFLKRNARNDPNAEYQKVGDKVFIKPDAKDNFYLALEDSVFYFSKTETSMRRVLGESGSQEQKAETHPTLAQVDKSATLWGFARGDALVPFWENLHNEDELPIEPIDGGLQLGQSTMRAIGFDMTPEGSEKLKLRLLCDISPVSPETQATLDQAVDAWLEDSMLTVEKTIEAGLDGYVITLLLSDFEKLNTVNIDID